MRFWVNILRNPHFIFDVHVTEVVDASLHVIGQTFMDACTKTEHKLSRVSSHTLRQTVLAPVRGFQKSWICHGFVRKLKTNCLCKVLQVKNSSRRSILLFSVSIVRFKLEISLVMDRKGEKKRPKY